ncbi:MAG: PQ-loop domain-containing transporter [Acidimicrobiales bacterium]
MRVRVAVFDAALACGYLGALLGVCMLVPQIVRSFRDRSLPGVSALSWALTGLASGAWLLYGLRVHEIPQVPGNVLVVAGTAVIVLAVPSPIGERGRATMLAAGALALMASAVVLPAAAVGLIAFGIGIISTLPQTIRSLVGLPVGTTSAVSVPSWLLRAAAQSCWLVFAIGEGDAVVFASAVIILSSSLLLCAVELRRRREDRSPRCECVSSAA